MNICAMKMIKIWGFWYKNWFLNFLLSSWIKNLFCGFFFLFGLFVCFCLFCLFFFPYTLDQQVHNLTVWPWNTAHVGLDEHMYRVIENIDMFLLATQFTNEILSHRLKRSSEVTLSKSYFFVLFLFIYQMQYHTTFIHHLCLCSRLHVFSFLVFVVNRHYFN